jgi:hypothetical protein
MKFFTLSVLMLCISGLVKGDVLRLRNGLEFTGHYIGGTNTEIWFQRDGMVPTTEVIPTSLVEGLKFEPGAVSPAAAQAAAAKRQAAPAQSWMSYFRTVFATAWFPYSSSTRTASVASPAGRLVSVTR